MESIAINKKNVFYWSLYDFAKAFTIITFSLYFSQWLVVDNKVSDIWYNLIFVGASVLLLVTAPVLAIIADKKNQSLPYLRLMALMLFLTTLACSLFAVLGGNSPKFALLAGVSFLLSNYFYQFSLIFYNGFLPQLAPRQSQGFISGLGYTANWLGMIIGILIALPFATGLIYWFGHPGRAQTLLPATLLFGIFALPMVLFFKDIKKPILAQASAKTEYKNFIRTFILLCKTPGIGRFLFGYFLFNDAILTLENNFAIYLEKVYHIGDKSKSFLLLALLLSSTAGALVCGWLGDKIGLKKSLMIILTVSFLILPFLAMANSFFWLYALTIALGIVYGGMFAVARAVLSYLAPPDKHNYAFSYYSLMERFATLAGPLAWGLTIFFLKNHGAMAYRWAVIVLAVFVAIGGLIIKKIPSDKSITEKTYGTSSQ